MYSIHKYCKNRSKSSNYTRFMGTKRVLTKATITATRMRGISVCILGDTLVWGLKACSSFVIQPVKGQERLQWEDMLETQRLIASPVFPERNESRLSSAESHGVPTALPTRKQRSVVPAHTVCLSVPMKLRSIVFPDLENVLHFVSTYCTR